MKTSTKTLLVMGLMSLHMVRYSMIFPFVPLLAEKMGASPTLIGVVGGAYSLMAVLAAVPVGGLSDRFGIKYLIIIGVLLSMVHAALLLTAGSIFMIILAQLLGGFSDLIHVVTIQTYISHLPGAYHRERGFGILAFSASLGQAVGPILAGVIVFNYGYTANFLAVIALSLPGFFILLLPEPQNGGQARRQYSIKGDLRESGRLLHDHKMTAVLIFAFTVVAAASLRSSFIPVYFRSRDLTEVDIGVLMTLFSVASTVVRFFMGRIVDLIGRRGLTVLAVVAVALGVGLVPLFTSSPTLGLTMLLFGLGFGFTQPLTMAMVSDLAEPEHAGLAMGLRFTVITTGALLGPIFFGYIVQVSDLSRPFYLAGLGVALVGLYITLLKPDLIPERQPDKI